MDIIIKIKQIGMETIKRFRYVKSIIYNKSEEILKIQIASKNTNFCDYETYNCTLDYEIIKISKVEE